MRAECAPDVFLFFQSVWNSPEDLFASVISIQSDDTGDCFVRMLSCEDLHTLREICRNVPDGHVMTQTIARAEDYTGIRNYDA